MEIILSESAGFCFGVNKAVNKVESLLAEGKKVATLGPLIHNPSYIRSLEDRGTIIVDNIEDVPENYELVIRAHGVTKDTITQLRNSGISFSDATCPFVMKIQKIIEKESTENNIAMIAGDEKHPEVIGFRSYCKGSSFVFKDSKELADIIENNENLQTAELIYVAQTTFSTEEYKKCSKIIKKYCTNVKIFDTICDATSKRQKDACNLSQRCDIIIIIGGRISSNTQKLKSVCEKNTKTKIKKKNENELIFFF